jgi:dienelactone hydrolase
MLSSVVLPSRASLTDYALLLALVKFAVALDGPGSVIVIAAAFAHSFLFGRPRAGFALAYVGVALAVLAFRYDGLHRWSTGAQAAVRALLAAAPLLAEACDRMLCPLRGSIARASGPFDVALCCVDGGDFMLRIYYPTERRSAAERIRLARRLRQPPVAGIPYFFHGTQVPRGMAGASGWPSLFLSWLSETTPWALEAAPDLTPVANAGGASGLSVAVFSHGMKGTPDIYGGLIAELVSHGVVVAAPDHTDGSASFALQDGGHQRRFDPMTAAEKKNRKLEFKFRRRQLAERVDNMMTAADILRNIAARGFDDDESEPNDIKLARLLLHGSYREDTPLYAIGHSFGGGTAIAVAERDKRYGGVVAFDPWCFPLSAVTLSRGLGPRTPALMLMASEWDGRRESEGALRVLFDAATRRSRIRQAGAAVATTATRGDGDEATSAAESAPPQAARPSSSKKARGKGAGARPSSDAATDGLEADAGEDGLDIVGSNGVAPDGTISEKMFVRSAAVHPSSSCVVILGAGHMAFCDLAVLGEALMRALGYIGSRSARESQAIASALALQFMASPAGQVGATLSPRQRGALAPLFVGK